MSLNNLELTRFFFAVVLLLVSSLWFGYVFQKYKLPRVIGEIVGGLVLGPTLLGYFAPNAYNWVFTAFSEEGKLISLIYWIGLILLMFISGFEIERSFSKGDKKIIIALLLGSTLIPFAAGWLAPQFYDFTPFLGIKGNPLALKIIIAIAVAVTSIPVISKIFIDLDIMNTRFARIVLATATIHDIILWVALAIATGLVSATALSATSITTTVIITLLFFGVALLVMPRLINYTSKLRYNLIIKSSVSGYALFICFFFAALASIMDVNIVFGAFLAGVIVGMLPSEKFSKVKENIKEFSLSFFIPIYFAVVGLKLDLVHHFDIIFFIGFFLFTAFFETLGTLLASKIVKIDWPSSFNLAVAMNTRGGPGIVLATVAYDMGIINQTFFVTLVMNAILTSLLAGYWFKFLLTKNRPLLRE